MKIVGIDERAEGEPRVAGLLRAQAISQHSVGWILAAESYETLGYSYLFLVNATFDLNHDRLIVVVGNMVHRLLDSSEITGTISGYYNLSFSHKNARKA